jgi:hypothetical protein
MYVADNMHMCVCVTADYYNFIPATHTHTLPEEALDCVKGYFVGLDITARSVQAVHKKQGLPWSTAKGYDTFGPVSLLYCASAFCLVGFCDCTITHTHTHTRTHTHSLTHTHTHTGVRNDPQG